MGLKDVIKEADSKLGSKLDSVITGEKKSAEGKVDDAVKEGKAELAKFESMMKDKENELDSVAADIGKKVLACADEGKQFDMSSISDLLDKAKEIKAVISDIAGKIEAFKK